MTKDVENSDGNADQSSDNELLWDNLINSQPRDFISAARGLGMDICELIEACRSTKLGDTRPIVGVKAPRHLFANYIVEDGFGYRLSSTVETIPRGRICQLDRLSLDSLDVNGSGYVYRVEQSGYACYPYRGPDTEQSEYECIDEGISDVYCYFELREPLHIVAPLLTIDNDVFQQLLSERIANGQRSYEERYLEQKAEAERLRLHNSDLAKQLKECTRTMRRDSYMSARSLIGTLYVIAGAPKIDFIVDQAAALHKTPEYESVIKPLGHSTVGEYTNGLRKRYKTGD